MLAPGAVVLVMLIPVAGKILNVVPAKYVIASGGLALGAALLYSMNLVPGPRFLASGDVARGTDRGAGAAVRADQHHRLCDVAAAS